MADPAGTGLADSGPRPTSAGDLRTGP